MSEDLEVLELVVIEPSTVLAAYTNGEGLDDAIDQVRGVVASFDHDMTTKTSRAKTASLAHKVAKVKTRLDAMGKELVTGWKDQCKKVDSSRKSMREAMDDLKVEARKPLDEWESKQAAIEAERVAIEEAEKLANQIESDHEIGLLMNDALDRFAAEIKAEADRLAKEAADREEQLRKDREANIAQEAAERATREANEQAAQAANQAARKEAEAAQAVKAAQQAEQRAKWEQEEALKQAEAQRVQAVKDAEAATERAEHEKAEAIKAAEQKAEREAKAKDDARIAEEQRLIDEQEARAANKAHCGKINRAVLADMMKAGIDEDTAKNLIGLIAKGQIAHTSIKY
jgi:uncharacterized protein YhaN